MWRRGVTNPPMTSAMAPPSRDWVEVCTIGDLLVRAAVAVAREGGDRLPGRALRSYAALPRPRRARRALAARARRAARRPRRDPDAELHRLPRRRSSAARCSASRSVPINARYKVHELRHVLTDGELVAIATTDLIVGARRPRRAPRRGARASGPRRSGTLILLGERHARRVPRPARRSSPPRTASPPRTCTGAAPRVRLRDEAMMMYTSGTTADPKGCVLTHEALVRTGIAAADRWQLVHDDRFWNAAADVPHGPGLPAARAHARRARRSSPARTSTPAVALRHDRGASGSPSRIPTFPAITQALINHPDFERDRPRHRPPRQRHRRRPRRSASVQAKFAPAPVVTLFGMTETCGGISWGAPDDAVREADDDGRLPAARHRGPDRRPRDGRGAAGRRARRDHSSAAPGLFERYHNDPEKTAEAMRGGWFHTGDLGRLDEDGRLTFLGRLKDMLKVGGENVAALEIEAYLGDPSGGEDRAGRRRPRPALRRGARRVRRARPRRATRPRRS